jgi:hypothetical protein
MYRVTAKFCFGTMMYIWLTLLISVGLIPVHFNYHYAIAQKCDQSLWRHIFQERRLTIIDSCKTVSGTIVSHDPREDGDILVRVKLDLQFTNLLTPSNYAQGNGYLVVEAICQTTPRVPPVIPFCKNFHQNINIPPVDTYVTITGSYVLDEEHQRWAEIHPVTSIVPSPAENITSPSTSELNEANSRIPKIIYFIDTEYCPDIIISPNFYC